MTPMPALVGERVRDLRKTRGLTLTALAEAAGIGKGSLSELENGLRNPTLATLYAVAGPLGVPLATLLEDAIGAEVESDGVHARLLDTARNPHGVREIYAIDFAPLVRREAPSHGPGVVEYLLITQGSATVGPLGQEQLVSAGESFAWFSDCEHVYAGGPLGGHGVLTIVSPPVTG